MENNKNLKSKNKYINIHTIFLAILWGSIFGGGLIGFNIGKLSGGLCIGVSVGLGIITVLQERYKKKLQNRDRF